VLAVPYWQPLRPHQTAKVRCQWPGLRLISGRSNHASIERRAEDHHLDQVGFLATSDEEFDWALKMNFFIGLRATRAALGPMLGQGSGSIVNVASVNSFFQPDAATVDYGVAKAAVVNLSKSLSQEFGPKGIRVNCVSPGQVGTDLWLGEHGVADTIANATGTDADTIRETAAAAIATGRFTTPEEVATLVTMLASDRTANVTGVNYVIDGGLIKTT
jgi:NAD(P)-dependent dehydrogenase (short-subunit alcohol dehydrogenase family)